MARIEVDEGLSLPTTAEDVRLGDELRSTLNSFAVGRVVSIVRSRRAIWKEGCYNRGRRYGPWYARDRVLIMRVVP